MENYIVLRFLPCIAWTLFYRYRIKNSWHAGWRNEVWALEVWVVYQGCPEKMLKMPQIYELIKQFKLRLYNFLLSYSTTCTQLSFATKNHTMRVLCQSYNVNCISNGKFLCKKSTNFAAKYLIVTITM